MSYDNPQTQIETFAVMDFGAAAGVTTHKIFGPAGKKGALKDIGVALTEATVFATTLGMIKVGTLADIDKYGILNIATGLASGAVFNSGGDTDAILDHELPADTIVVVTCVEGTGASLTGQGVPQVTIDWF